jgi:hypothetical protein
MIDIHDHRSVGGWIGRRCQRKKSAPLAAYVHLQATGRAAYTHVLRQYTLYIYTCTRKTAEPALYCYSELHIVLLHLTLKILATCSIRSDLVYILEKNETN